MSLQNQKASYTATERELVSLSVYNVGYEKCSPLHSWGPGVRDHYLIHYIVSGKGEYEVNGEIYSLSKGDAFLVYPNTEVRYQADADDPWEYAWVGFSGSDAPMLLGATDFTPSHPVFSCDTLSNEVSGNAPENETYFDAGAQIERQLLHIYDARGNTFQHMVEMTGRLYTTLSLFIKSSSAKEVKSTTNTYVQKAIEYITNNYSYPITVEDIAKYVGISRSHLFRCFQTTMGESPKEYLTSYRIKQACYLLRHSNLSITAIANSLGFDNSLYFSKSFHKITKMTPTNYRKELVVSK
ncbi:MAG: AraC family transcriptional regulator [Lachnospiraceae bacterium]|nr:AraC family transcriptional regulator [Lachnospiraceae bacterium]